MTPYIISYLQKIIIIIQFFSFQQFITRRMKADCGSYFRNYVHDTQTNMKMERK